MKINKIWAALLALIMLAALAACADDGADVKQSENEFKFMQSESGQIRQADIDYLKRCMLENGPDDEFDDIEALTSLAVMRAVVWEAEELGLAESLDEVREKMTVRYQEFVAAAADESNPEHDMAVWIIDYAQKMKQQVPMTDDDYLDYTALNQQVTDAYTKLQERFEADLPPEVREDVWLKVEALQEYIKSLLEKYHDELVEPELLPLLDEILKNM